MCFKDGVNLLPLHSGFAVSAGQVDKVDIAYTNFYIGKFIFSGC